LVKDLYILHKSIEVILVLSDGYFVKKDTIVFIEAVRQRLKPCLQYPPLELGAQAACTRVMQSNIGNWLMPIAMGFNTIADLSPYASLFDNSKA